MENKISAQEKSELNDAISTLRQDIAKDNYDEILVNQKKLQDLLMEVGKKVYSQANSTVDKSEKKDDDTVIDTNSSQI